MKFTKDEEAVSPVIGVILMVAITVILAAVIATFVFGMAGNIQSSKTVAFTAQKTKSGIEITCHGGADIDKLSSINVTVDDVKEMTLESVSTGWTNTTEAKTGRVIIVGNFDDGSSQVLLDKTIK
ncbi:MAG: type IV pilin [Methanoculleaceae archaeon]